MLIRTLLYFVLPLALAHGPQDSRADLRKRADVGKKVIQMPLERAIAARAPARPITPTSARPTNRAVAPGLVRWHDDFGAACAAARRSHKPVLLFQMLGRLDEELC